MRLFGMIIVLGCVLPRLVMAEVEVIDGDSFWLNGQEMRLEGIDAPEYNQQCYDAKENLYNCGQKATQKLRELIKKDIKCKQLAVDKYKRKVVICKADGKELNKEMVAAGWAIAYKRYSRDYEDDERLAEKAKKGIWQGRFMRPELFRALNR